MANTRSKKDKSQNQNRNSGTGDSSSSNSSNPTAQEISPNNIFSPLVEETQHPSPDFRQFGSQPQQMVTQMISVAEVATKFESLTSALESTQSQMADMFKVIKSLRKAQKSGRRNKLEPTSVPSSSQESTCSRPFQSALNSKKSKSLLTPTDANLRNLSLTSDGHLDENSQPLPDLSNIRSQITRNYVEQYGPDTKTHCEVARERIVPINQIIPPKFDGTRSKARSWLKEYTHAQIINGYSETQMFAHVSVYLTGNAWNWWVFESVVNPDWDWYSFRNAFLKCYLGNDTSASLAKRIDAVRQKSDEPPFDFLTRAVELCHEYDPHMQHVEIVKRVKAGFLPDTFNLLWMQLHEDEWTLEWLKNKLLSLRPTNRKDTRDPKSGSTPRDIQAKESKPPMIVDLADWTCFNCSKKGHTIDNCDKPKSEQTIDANKKAYSIKKKAEQEVAPKLSREVNNL